MTETTQFDITASAARRIHALLADEQDPGHSAFRIAVDGGGCSGFQYRFEITAPAPEDAVFSKDGAKVVVDGTSLPFLNGAMIDYVETLAGSSFEIRNPNTTARCGCGNSFSVV